MGVFGRANPVVRRRDDGRFDLLLDDRVREVLDDALGAVATLLEDPDEPALARLNPPAYPDDPDREAGYRLLAGDELRESQLTSIGGLRDLLARDVATGDELWSAIRALNSVRLVTGTVLGIESEDVGPPHDLDEDDPVSGMWALYDLTNWVQHHIVQVL